MPTDSNMLRVKTEKEFIIGLVRTGAWILFVTLIITAAAVWFTTHTYDPHIHHRALRTGVILPMLIVPGCVFVVGRQNLRDHRQMLKINQLAHTDEMTGLANRRFFMSEAVARLEAMDADTSGLCLLIVDLDHFKAVNDKYGHIAGDKTLIHVAKRMELAMPSTALIARLGGEEFSIMVSFEDMEDIQRLAETLRQSVADSPCRVDAHTIRVTISVGIGIACSEDTVSSVMSRADCALYAAKDEGRNRFSIAA